MICFVPFLVLYKGNSDATVNVTDVSSSFVRSYAIHSRFGSGLLEKAYRVILATELRRLGHKVEEEKVCGFSYNGQDYQNMFRLDLLVDDEVVVELKSVTRKEPVFFKQCLTYLRLLDKRLGFVINFGMPSLKEGIDRVVNKL